MYPCLLQLPQSFDISLPKLYGIQHLAKCINVFLEEEKLWETYHEGMKYLLDFII